MILSKKVGKIAPSITLEITAKAKKMKAEGTDVIILAAGEPDFNTPLNIQNAAIEAIKNGYTKYTPASGIDELKTAICNKFKRDNNLNYSSSQIIISTGAKQCISNVFQAILNQGDEVIIPKPYWVSYPELIKLSDGVPVYVSGSRKNDFKYEEGTLRKAITPETKAILLNSPNNPTGAIYSKEELSFIANIAKENDLIIISDEIYENFNYGNSKCTSIASLSEDAYNRTVVINGVSKTYSMTGWRIGYAAGSEKIINFMNNVQSHTTANPNSIAQYAVLEALNGDQSSVGLMVKQFKDRRDYIVEEINSNNILSCLKPSGAFYIMIDISKMLGKVINGNRVNNSIDFCSLLLDEEKVAVIPGDGFGVSNYVRLSYAVSMETIKEGIKRILNFVQKYQ
ncbi:aspartate aminotransferase [Clostridium algifaecis]|uniref:Aminotransferase n=1 Tax=Clostridium algifaecis TaxID=1472040 RepID=A0ABS4KU77_9CLOT|nr:pyridoxal phosphate-dependent aminotransferase [Clostridium algifaecis]MBP2033597.1 aspartate aminotransferase [Clostridium algifaecis]